MSQYGNYDRKRIEQERLFKLRINNKHLPPEILDGFQEVANRYTHSPATTNAGRILRFIVKILPVKLVAQIFSEKFK